MGTSQLFFSYLLRKEDEYSDAGWLGDLISPMYNTGTFPWDQETFKEVAQPAISLWFQGDCFTSPKVSTSGVLS